MKSLLFLLPFLLAFPVDAHAQDRRRALIAKVNADKAGGGAADDTTNLAAQWKADSATGANNDPVSTWPDSTVNALDLSAAGGVRPLLQTSGPNGHKSLLFDGTDDVMSRSVTGSALFGATAVTLFFVIKQDASQANNGVLGWQEATTSTGVGALATYSDVFYFDNPDNGAGGRLSAAQPVGWDDAWHVVEYYRSGANAEILVDGASLATTSGLSGSVDVTKTAIVFVGAHFSSIFLKGELAEVRCYSVAKDSTARTTIRAKLKSDYGTP